MKSPIEGRKVIRAIPYGNTLLVSVHPAKYKRKSEYYHPDADIIIVTDKMIKNCRFHAEQGVMLKLQELGLSPQLLTRKKRKKRSPKPKFERHANEVKLF